MESRLRAIVCCSHKQGIPGAECGETDAGAAGEPAVDVRHEGGTLFVERRHEGDLALNEGIEQGKHLLAGHAEHVFDTLLLQRNRASVWPSRGSATKR